MTRSEDSHNPDLAPLVLSTLWTRALVWLVLSLIGLLLGWQLGTSGHSRLPSATQMSPALPELRAETNPQPSLSAAGEASQTPSRAPLPGWTELRAVTIWQGFVNELNLIALGRMNLDGG